MKVTPTDDQLRDLFARHCECRPLDLSRSENDHSHDCDTAILHDVQIALGLFQFNDIGRIQAMREARDRCAKMLLWTRNALGGWDTPQDAQEIT